MTRRADRLFQIVQILRGRRLTTAAHLAERLGVSERTVYRDIRDLSLSGVPVEGEAGSGYRLSLSRELESAQEKVLAILPEESRRKAEQTRIYAPDIALQLHSRSGFDVIHQAISAQRVLALHYRDEAGQLSKREVQPLGLFFWGERWLLAAWCERRDDYRCFRLDRCLNIVQTERRFSESADRSLADFLRKVRQ
ncbi:MAG: YafY family protein [Enterobacter hormaechei]|nr:YafY family protein [Enterobacter hormaechei]